MTQYGASIQLTQNMTSVLNSVITAVNMTIGTVESMQSSIDGFDASGFDVIQDTLAQAQVAVDAFHEKMQEPVKVPEPEITWTSSNFDVFTNTGVERFENEILSVNSMMEKLTQTQNSISQNANNIELLPQQAVTDIQNVQNRVQELISMIEQAENTSLDIGSDEANSQLEQLRMQLNSALHMQENLEQAMQSTNVSNINNAYLKLSETIGNIERSVRDSFSQPIEIPVTWTGSNFEVFTDTGVERFTSEIQSAVNMIDRLTTAQRSISENAARTNVFSKDAVLDMVDIGNKMNYIQNRIQQIESNPANPLDPNALNELESLRQQLSQAITYQEQMNAAVENLDVSRANQLYQQLNNIVNQTEQEIRDNVNAQGQFNSSINEGVSASDNLKDAISSIVSAFGLYKIADVLNDATQDLISLSDEMTGYEARLMLNVDEGSINEVKAKIYNAAQDSRADYTDMMATVSKLGVLAGDSFSDSLGNVNYDQIIDFQNLMNKNFAIGGASAEEQAAAMYQLTQAMASGKLQGDEFRSITENAPLLNQAIEDYMTNIVGVDGTMKEWAADGLLTADVIKNAVFSSADEINAKFETIPMTWGQVGTQLKNEAVVMFEPVLAKINELANNENFVSMINSVISGLTTVVSIASWVIDLMVNGALFIYDHWNIIGPIFYGVTAVLAVLAAAWVFNKLQLLGAAIAQALVNSKMLTTIIIIIAVVAAIFLVANAIVEMTGCANSGFSAIVGGIYVVGAWFENLWYMILNIGNGISTLFDAVTYNFRLAFHNAIAHVQSWFYGLLSTATTVIAGICELLNKLPFVEFDYSGIVSKASEYAEKSAAAENSISTAEYKSLSDAFNAGFNTYDAFNEGWAAEAFANGTEKGDSISENLKGLFSAETIAELGFGGNETDYADYLTSIEDFAGNTANATSDIKDSIDEISEDQLEWLRKIADRETVNRFTTAEIKLDFTSSATLNSDMDIDGYINTFTRELQETLVSTAEGLEE